MSIAHGGMNVDTRTLIVVGAIGGMGAVDSDWAAITFVPNQRLPTAIILQIFLEYLWILYCCSKPP